MLKNIIWDFDGTLFDSYPVMVEAFQKALKERNIIETFENIMSIMKESHRKMFSYYEKKYGLKDDFIKRFQEIRVEDEIFTCIPFEHAKEVCKKVFESGKDNFLYTHRDNSANYFLKTFEMENYFKDSITTEHEEFYLKPSPKSIEYFINKYNLNKDETIIIGDREIDVLSGKNAGIKGCLIFSDKNIETKADFVVRNLFEIEKILEI